MSCRQWSIPNLVQCASRPVSRSIQTKTQSLKACIASACYKRIIYVCGGCQGASWDFFWNSSTPSLCVLGRSCSCYVHYTSDQYCFKISTREFFVNCIALRPICRLKIAVEIPLRNSVFDTIDSISTPSKMPRQTIYTILCILIGHPHWQCHEPWWFWCANANHSNFKYPNPI